MSSTYEEERALLKAKVNASELGTSNTTDGTVRREDAEIPIATVIKLATNSTSFEMKTTETKNESAETSSSESVRSLTTKAKDENNSDSSLSTPDTNNSSASISSSTPVRVNVGPSESERAAFSMNAHVEEKQEEGKNNLESKSHTSSEESKSERSGRYEGLEVLANVKCLKMRQLFNPREHFIDWRVDNFFRVTNADTGENLFEAQESTAKCSRFCCFGRKTMVRINDVRREAAVSKARPDLLYLKKPYRCDPFGFFRPKLTVYSVPSAKKREETLAAEFGVPIGTIICPFLTRSIGVDIYSKTGEFVYQIRASRCQAAIMCCCSCPCGPFKRAEFRIQKVIHGNVQEQPVGRLVKFLRPSKNKGRWPFIKDTNIGANTFYLDLGSANYATMSRSEWEDDGDRSKLILAEHKALLLAAVFLLDALFFPTSRERPQGKRIKPFVTKVVHKERTWHQGRLEATLESEEANEETTDEKVE